jgi:hypothetical protein
MKIGLPAGFWLEGVFSSFSDLDPTETRPGNQLSGPEAILCNPGHKFTTLTDM